MSFSRFDHQCMAEALQLAALGMFTTQPNPRVGCVIAREGRVVGRGYHRRAGEPHAEVLALEDAAAAGSDGASDVARNVVRGATAYVTLEPCSHHGRTPPCAEALVASGIVRVVMAMQDPHEVVNGGGQRILQDAGIVVETGLMSAVAEALNPGFLQRVRHGRPYVRIKLAASLDGRTALASGASQWISSAESRLDVQRWRARSSAILTGIGTVMADDPQMTVRIGGSEHQSQQQPIRVVADSHWRTPVTSRIVNLPGRVIIAGSEQHAIPADLSTSGAQLLPLRDVDGKLDLRQLLEALAEEQVNELQVEAGETLCGALLKQGLVDELLLYQAPVIMGEGGTGLFAGLAVDAMENKVQLQLIESCFIGVDQRLRFRPVQQDKS
ncbi:MAG: bifunctional diaminohydroxyphosphoribosylaminopyrimidine deaminase/5-amino-6-(5-phosphoribosylamino)uracil reductase RibD [Xanthomonadales bacterium]|nr:bifunctional diaminohydroxyphosphoribosylaminopyrimidine deaminase/5-amino-6-(5-phosphoribosylamino)uracil reductase RibD [Xanthomonadales bacterium]